MGHEVEEYWISDYYLSALINGDYSSFDYYFSDVQECDREIKRFDDWLDETQDDRSGHWTTPDEPETDEFGECEVTGLRGKVEKVLFVPMSDAKRDQVIDSIIDEILAEETSASAKG
jgi:hypothetical protein